MDLKRDCHACSQQARNDNVMEQPYNLLTPLRHKLKIAFTGIRGIPASYSGFETFVEELSDRLVQKNIEVSVYNRSTHYKNRPILHKGARILYLPTIPSKHLDTIVHTFIVLLHALFKKYDIVYICGVGNSMVSWIPRITGKKVILNVDGRDWQRKKWGSFAKAYLRFAEKMAPKSVHLVITDSMEMKNYYKRVYNAETIFVPYGGNMAPDTGIEYISKFALEPDRYILFVGRLEPENNAHILIKAFKELSNRKNFTLVIVGDAPYAETYKASLKSLARNGADIIFTGFVFGDGYRQLSTHAYGFVLASEVGGTHPVLVEQMSIGNCIIASNTESNLEVLGNAGLSFDLAKPVEDLANKLKHIMENPAEVRTYKNKARERAFAFYSWDAIADQYLHLFDELLKH